MKLPSPALLLLMAPLLLRAGDDGRRLDISERARVEAWYWAHEPLETSLDLGWTGNVGQCQAGTISEAAISRVISRVNYFRALAGVHYGVRAQANLCEKAQAAALMMAANGSLSHDPPTSWSCYTELGAEGAAGSNLQLNGSPGEAILFFMEDFGVSNADVLHRTSLLWPQQDVMGFGAVENPTATALWALGPFLTGVETKRSRDNFVAWPPAGYVPRAHLYPRWSWAAYGSEYFEARLDQAKVTVRRNGQQVGVTVISRGVPPEGKLFVGGPPLAWELPGTMPQVGDLFAVTISGLRDSGGGALPEVSYTVRVFEPGPRRAFLFDRYTLVNGDYRQVPWLGWVQEAMVSPWFYHFGLGWLYPDNLDEQSLWVWGEGLGWFWTRAAWFPVIYRWEDGTYYWYDVGSEPRRFWSYEAGAWIEL